MLGYDDYGFVKVSACSFPIELGNVKANADKMIKCIEKAKEDDVNILVFPELSLTGYTCGDLFLRHDFYTKTISGLSFVRRHTDGIAVCVGMQVEQGGRLFNCAVWLKDKKVIGVVPKTFIPNYSEFYEKRWFVPGQYKTSDTVEILTDVVPFNENLLLDFGHNLIVGTEICEDLWVDCPPSGMLTRAGATIIVNPSASTETIGKSEYRRNLVKMQSARCKCGYVYASSGVGESSTDLVFSGHVMVAENGRLLEDSNDETVTALIDVEKCINERKRLNSDCWTSAPEVQFVKVRMGKRWCFPNTVSKYPFVPSDGVECEERCNEILRLQARGLAQRMEATGIKDLVLGLSGGSDSTLALLVCVEAMKLHGLTNEHIHCLSMPCFGTTSKTKKNAQKLAESFGVTYKKIDITKACKQHLKDLNHSLTEYDITYENTQARERTQVLFDYANMNNCLVIGTGDMSELALGWCTYNGDHMSNYAVNASIPKTLVKYIIQTKASSERGSLRDTLLSICATPISPELLPAAEDGSIAQKTEESIGKYALHDFFLYHYLRNGFSRDKIFALATVAFNDISEEEITATLDTFYTRFRTQQFKRSCAPDGVKVGSVALSPRGDLRMPSDLATLY